MFCQDVAENLISTRISDCLFTLDLEEASVVVITIDLVKNKLGNYLKIDNKSDVCMTLFNDNYYKRLKFQVGTSLNFEINLEKGKYFVLPQTTGYLIQFDKTILGKKLSSKSIPFIAEDLLYSLDVNNKGYLNGDALKKVIERVGLKLNADEIKELCMKHTGKQDFINLRGLTNLLKTISVNLNESQNVDLLYNLGYDADLYPFYYKSFVLTVNATSPFTLEAHENENGKHDQFCNEQLLKKGERQNFGENIDLIMYKEWICK